MDPTDSSGCSFAFGPWMNRLRRVFGQALSRAFGRSSNTRPVAVWAPPGGLAWNPLNLVPACARRTRAQRLDPRCERCVCRRLVMMQQRQETGFEFKCPCGGRACWLAVRLNGALLGVVILRESHGRNPSGGLALNDRSRAARFWRDCRYLRLLVHDLVTSVKEEIEREELGETRHELDEHRREETRLRGLLNRLLPAAGQGPPIPATSGPSTGVVEHLLGRIQRDFQRPLVLKELAAELGMNASYLSELFARRVGLSFKRYLVTCRLQRAQELLREPERSIAQVASAVGYASAERFRAAFARVIGESPSAWRALAQGRDTADTG